MNEIQVGEYIRTPSGHIDVIVNKDKCVSRYLYNVKSDGKYITDQDIKLHSFNKIDLIEKGDVIKYISNEVYYKKEVWMTKNNIVYTTDGIKVNIDKIATIVTKEQFAESEYKINEN